MPPVSVPRAPLHERQIHIPFELIERFLSFVATFDRNKKTHLACSLTCREWRAVCMPFLFSSMSAHHPDRLIALLTLGRDDRSRNFACSVRKLELADGIMTAKLFISILETFPKLRCLWLDGVRFELASSSELPPGHPTFELDTLIIDGRLHDPPYLLDVHVLLDAFRAFAHINTLYLSGPSAETSFRPPPKEPRSSLQLQVHNIAGPVPARLWLSLLRCTRTIEDQTLQTVRIDVEHSATEEFGELLSTGGANLRSVDIGFSRGPYNERSGDHLKLSYCRNLTHVAFNFGLTLVESPWAWPFVWNLVSSLPPDSLTTLGFNGLGEIILSDQRSGDASGLKGLRTALAPLLSLNEVTIADRTVAHTFSPDKYKSFVEDLLLPTESGYRLVVRHLWIQI